MCAILLLDFAKDARTGFFALVFTILCLLDTIYTIVRQTQIGFREGNYIYISVRTYIPSLGTYWPLLELIIFVIFSWFLLSKIIQGPIKKRLRLSKLFVVLFAYKFTLAFYHILGMFFYVGVLFGIIFGYICYKNLVNEPEILSWQETFSNLHFRITYFLLLFDKNKIFNSLKRKLHYSIKPTQKTANDFLVINQQKIRTFKINRFLLYFILLLGVFISIFGILSFIGYLAQILHVSESPNYVPDLSKPLQMSPEQGKLFLISFAIIFVWMIIAVSVTYKAIEYTTTYLSYRKIIKKAKSR